MTLSIDYIPTADLLPYAMNSRTHSDDQVAQIAASIKEFGFTNPILIDDEQTIIAGHGRIMAAKKLKLSEVPTITLEGLTEAQKKAYVIADNKLALNAGWDTEALTAELRRLQELEFDLDLIGFDSDELAQLLEPEQVEGLTDEDDVPDVPETPKTVEGDIWVLGNHRLMCGDSTSIDAVDKLMDGEDVDCVYTDPPYGIDIVKGGHVGGEKLASVGTYAPVANDNSIEVAVQAIQVIQTLRAKVEIIWGGNYYATSLANSSCWIVWDKENTGNFADCELAWTNQTTAVRKFSHMWNGMLKASERGEKRCHPTQKPVALAEWCFDAYAEDCETVLDLFGGSGSTLIGCETKNKRSFVMELSPLYCDVIIKRWQDYTGKKAVHADTGEAFDE